MSFFDNFMADADNMIHESAAGKYSYSGSIESATAEDVQFAIREVAQVSSEYAAEVTLTRAAYAMKHDTAIHESVNRYGKEAEQTLIAIHEAVFAEGGFIDKIIKFIKKIFEKIKAFFKKVIGYLFKNPDTFMKKWRQIKGLLDELNPANLKIDSKAKANLYDRTANKNSRIIAVISKLASAKGYIGEKQAGTHTNSNGINTLLGSATADKIELSSLIGILEYLLESSKHTPVNGNSTGVITEADMKKMEEALDKIKSGLGDSTENAAYKTLRKLFAHDGKYPIDSGSSDEDNKLNIFKDESLSESQLVSAIKDKLLPTEKKEKSGDSIKEILKLIGELYSKIDGVGIKEIMEKGVDQIDTEIKVLDMLSSKLKAVDKNASGDKWANSGANIDNSRAGVPNANAATGNSASATAFKGSADIAGVANKIGTIGSKIATRISDAMSLGVSVVQTVMMTVSTQMMEDLTTIDKLPKIS